MSEEARVANIQLVASISLAAGFDRATKSIDETAVKLKLQFDILGKSLKSIILSLQKLTVSISLLVSRIGENLRIRFKSKSGLGRPSNIQKVGESLESAGLTNAIKFATDFGLQLDAITQDLVGFQQAVDDATPDKGDAKKEKKKRKGFFSSIGKMASAMTAFSLVLGPTSAFMDGLLSPVQILTPMFGAWGSILGTALLPLMPVLVAAFEALTPIIVAVAEKLALLIGGLVNFVGRVVDFFRGEDISALTTALQANDLGAIADEFERMGFNLDRVNELREREADLLERTIAAREQSLANAERFQTGSNDLFGDPREIEQRLLD